MYKRIAYSYLALANVYREIGDYKRALLQAHKGIKLYDSINFSTKVAFAVTGSIYERQNRLDSALIYMQKAYELDIIQHGGNWGWLIYVLGNIQAKMKHYDVALAYYRVALPLASKDKYLKDILVPAHHYFEDLIKKKLVRKRKARRSKTLNKTQDNPATNPPNEFKSI